MGGKEKMSAEFFRNVAWELEESVVKALESWR